MMTREAQGERKPDGHPGRHRLLPLAGGGVAAAALLAHLGAGAALMHVGLPALLAYLGVRAAPGNLAGGSLVVELVTIAVMVSLIAFGVRRWLRHHG